MLLKDFANGHKLAVAPYKNGVMLIIRANEPGQPDSRILLNSSKFTEPDKKLIRSGKLEEFVLSRANYNVVRSESGDFHYLVPPSQVTDINPDWSQSGENQGSKPWWENLFNDEDGTEVPF